MQYITRISLYRYGVQFCEQEFLPRLIRHLEPPRDEGRNVSTSLEVDSLVTEYELKETLEKYQFADKYLKLGLIAILVLIAPGVSAIFDLVSNILDVPDGIVFLFILVCELASFVFLLGAYMRVKSRWEEWQEIAQREILVEKIEYYAKATSSRIIAQILVDIEKTKETQKQEAEKAKAYSTIHKGAMETFFLMIDERERGKKGKELRKQVVAFLVGYFAGKGLDAIFGVRIGQS